LGKVSPDGNLAFLAYLDGTGAGIRVQQVDPKAFTAVGPAITIPSGVEGLCSTKSFSRFAKIGLAGGLVAQNDGFALLTREKMPASTANAPPDGTPVAVLYRFVSGKQTWKTWLGGPDVHPKEGVSES
jgi:hypothetical protein